MGRVNCRWHMQHQSLSFKDASSQETDTTKASKIAYGYFDTKCFALLSIKVHARRRPEIGNCQDATIAKHEG